MDVKVDGSARLFVAVEPPEEIRIRLEAVRRDFIGGRTAPPFNPHLTLRFIGEVPGEKAAAVRKTLCAVRAAPFELRAHGLGFFEKRWGAVLWAGLEPSAALAELKRLVDAALWSGAGLAAERGGFAPHITLARVKTPVPLHWRTLVQNHPGVAAGFPVTGFTLFRSLLAREGARHFVEERYPLAGSST